MARSSKITRKTSVEATNNFGERTVAFLRRAHPAKTAESVAAATGIPASRVAKWLERACDPKGADSLRLVGAYGPEFLCAVFAERCPAWLHAAAREEEQRRLRAEIAALEARLNGAAP